MKNNYKMAIVETKLHADHGITKPCLHRWQKQYHAAIKKYVDEEKINRVGGPMHVCAVDESHVGKLGYMVGKKATSGGQSRARSQESRRGCLVKPSGIAVQGMVKKKHGTSKDTRKHSRWMWFGVDCGVKQVKTHGKGTKRVAASVLDHPETALEKKPRGAASISKVLSEHVKPGSKIASDGWISTTKAAKEGGLKMLGTGVHGTNFRNPKTGLHGNDAESEVARYKKWHRSKWTSVRTLNTKDQAKKQNHPEGKILEYVLQTDTGDAMQVDMATIMQALSKLAGEQTWQPVSLL